MLVLPAGKVDQEEDDADNEEYQHSRGQPHHPGVVLLGQVLLGSLQHLVDRPPELHRLERRSVGVVVVLVLTGGVGAVPPQHVDHHPGQVQSVAQRDGHGDDGEDGHDQRHEAHHEASRPQVDTATGSLETGHCKAFWSDLRRTVLHYYIWYFSGSRFLVLLPEVHYALDS